ncbi:hypothetical protein Cch01nite_10420 [Cellulomonas chitinilytica]|uniref:YdhG-like domain-containing protein n=1 Tax=Cellulomonas chitinilytica TaxID=398759 RepID=A0A919TZ04_9CELL|nr:DUF1801 domain-containing protein [Cellulomonas chitinilytica]GIG20318.1 hypothetical protein Cch01nite_10420 [Cellulomonas chitinilytica]
MNVTTASSERGSGAFTDAEKAAMKERAKEVRRSSSKNANGEPELLEKIAEMDGADRVMAEKVHAIITAAAPSLAPTLWYGMPAYARNGKAVVFFQPTGKFKARYSTLGFNDSASLDDGSMWPTSFALTELTPADEARIAELVQRAAG